MLTISKVNKIVQRNELTALERKALIFINCSRELHLVLPFKSRALSRSVSGFLSHLLIPCFIIREYFLQVLYNLSLFTKPTANCFVIVIFHVGLYPILLLLVKR